VQKAAVFCPDPAESANDGGHQQRPLQTRVSGGAEIVLVDAGRLFRSLGPFAPVRSLDIISFAEICFLFRKFDLGS